jgi:hypothetical protein
VILAGCCIKLTPPYVVLDNPTISASQNVAPPAGELSDFESQLLPAHEEHKKDQGLLTAHWQRLLKGRDSELVWPQAAQKECTVN